MKITLITPFFPHPNRGHAHGAERYAEGLVIGLKKAGHEVKIVTSFYNGKKRIDFFQGIPILRIHDSNSLLNFHGSIFFLHYISFGFFSTRKSIFNFYKDSDVIITDIALGWSKFFRKKIPLVSVFFHYDEDLTTKGFFYRLFYINFLRFIEKQYFKGKRNIIAISKKSKLDLIQKYNIPEETITVIPIGIDLEKFNPKNYSNVLKEKYNDYTILYSSLTVYRKRLPVLLRAMQRVIKEIPSVHLILTGGGPLWEYCKNLARNIGIENNTTFLGFINDKLLQCLYASCNLFVFPSEKEGFGQVILEAMASGTPVICADVSPMADILEKGGKTFQVNNYEDLSRKIIKIFKNEEELNNYQKKVYEIAQKYEWSKIIGIYSEYLKNLKYFL